MRNIRIIRPKELCKLLGISISTLYDWLTPTSSRFDGSFPPRIKIGRRAVGFDVGAIEGWLRAKAEEVSVSAAKAKEGT